MTNIKTQDLTGGALDWAVAEATGQEFFTGVTGMQGYTLDQLGWHPSTDWSQGGPLIEQHGITITDSLGADNLWRAAGVIWLPGHDFWLEGETPLIAACRAIVDAKLGYEVDVPEELDL